MNTDARPDDALVDRATRALLEGGDLSIFGPRAEIARPVDPAEEMDPPMVAAVWALWLRQAAASPDGRPTRKSLLPEHLGIAMGSTVLLDVEREGYDARYRIYGSQVAAYAGADWTGHLVSEMANLARTQLTLFHLAVYRATWLSGSPWFTRHAAPDWATSRSWDRLVVPLWGEDQSITHYLSVVQPFGGHAHSASEISARTKRLQEGETP